MRFEDIIGHATIKENMRQMVDNRRIPHAILLHGPQGVGKMQLARAFADYINCRHRRNGDSCGECPSCKQSDSLNHPDIHYIYPTVKPKNAKSVISSDRLSEWKEMLRDHPWMEPEAWQEIMQSGNSVAIIPVTDSDEISRIASLSTYSGDYKIFIIWQPEKMNLSSANKLLKLLEEPYSDTIFLLVSDHPEQLLPTISSRLQSIEAGRLSEKEIYDMMLKRGIDTSTAMRIAAQSEGRPGLAEQKIRTDSETEEFSIYFRQIMRNAYAMKGSELKKQSEDYASMGREKGIRLLQYIANQVRENFIYNLATPGLNNMTDSELEFSKRFAPFIHAGNVERIMNSIDKSAEALGRNANAKITWFEFQMQILLSLRVKIEN